MCSRVSWHRNLHYDSLLKLANGCEAANCAPLLVKRVITEQGATDGVMNEAG